ncbi:MAG TPA: hypothetical protein VKP64_04600 [Mycobacteriales bacterium]|nr:hypothetical protein [Mycobacteriales bacterium]
MFRRADFTSWDQLLTYLEGRLQHDEQVDNEFSEVESREIVADVRRLRDGDAPFSPDPHGAYETLRKA